MKRKEYLGHLLGTASKALGREATSRVKQFNLTIQQFGVLNVLYSGDRLTSHKLVSRLSSDSSSIMSLVDQLERKGMVRRDPGLEDRRIKYLVLTDKALSIRDELTMEVDKLDGELTRLMTQEERANLMMALRKILDHTLK